MSAQQSQWGSEIAVEAVNGVPYRMYSERPQRVEDVLPLADRWGDRPHVIQQDRILTFAELRHAASAKAGELAALGVQPGGRIVLLGWNGPEWVVNFWACLLVGAVPVLANTWWTRPSSKAASR